MTSTGLRSGPGESSADEGPGEDIEVIKILVVKDLQIGATAPDLRELRGLGSNLVRWPGEAVLAEFGGLPTDGGCPLLHGGFGLSAAHHLRR